MIVAKLQSFIEHPYTRAVDVAAVATGAASALTSAYPDFRASLHEWAALFVDIAPIATVFWLLIQGVCKIIVTYHVVYPSDEDEE